MQLENYYSVKGDQVYFSRQQASNFAKFVADDFNPLHDIDTKRFCVPGDLLFVVALEKTGLGQHMSISFTDKVGEGIPLSLATQNLEQGEEIALTNGDKKYLVVNSSGKKSHSVQLISDLSRAYVSYSGKAFPHILVPLMQSQSVMINPERPLVMYQSAELSFQHLDFSQPELRQSTAELKVNGKRGAVSLGFDIYAQGEKVGQGEKCMVLSGLREYKQQEMEGLVNFYVQRRDSMFPENHSL